MRILQPGPWGHGSRLGAVGSKIRQSHNLCEPGGVVRSRHHRIVFIRVIRSIAPHRSPHYSRFIAPALQWCCYAPVDFVPSSAPLFPRRGFCLVTSLYALLWMYDARQSTSYAVEIGFNRSRDTSFDPSSSCISVYNVEHDSPPITLACSPVTKSSASTASISLPSIPSNTIGPTPLRAIPLNLPFAVPASRSLSTFTPFFAPPIPKNPAKAFFSLQLAT